MTMNNDPTKKTCSKGIKKPHKDKIAKFHNVDRYTCMACGVEDVIVDAAHIIALQNDGSNEMENLHLLCKVCHVESEYLEEGEYNLWMELKREFYTKGAYSSTYGLDAYNRFLILDRLIRSAKPNRKGFVITIFKENGKLPEEDALSRISCFDFWNLLNGDLHKRRVEE